MLAHAALQAIEQPLPEYRTSTLGRLRRTKEAEAEARRAYRTGQSNRCWCKHNPNPADAVTAVSKAPDNGEGTHRTVSADIRRRDRHLDGYGAIQSPAPLTLTHQQDLGTVVKHVKENTMITRQHPRSRSVRPARAGVVRG
ncbi:hypothetical protein GCM10010232_70470 [Streptomyces amakusaensis]